MICCQGVSEAGMSGDVKWNPFQISQDEYEEFTLELQTTPEKAWQLVNVQIG